MHIHIHIHIHIYPVYLYVFLRLKLIFSCLGLIVNFQLFKFNKNGTSLKEKSWEAKESYLASFNTSLSIGRCIGLN